MQYKLMEKKFEHFTGFQGETLEELKLNLRDIYKELTSGRIPCVHHVAELEIAWHEAKRSDKTD
jgi:hypothetical protein